MLKLVAPEGELNGRVELPSSKSESNRVLIINALINNTGELNNLSDSNDTQILVRLLEQFKTGEEMHFDVGHAGTTFRFLLAFLALKTKKTVILKGSKRMHERPCGELVEALCSLGADINYEDKIGYGPLRIKPAILKGGHVQMRGDISSQFMSAIMLIAPTLEQGLTIELQTDLVSRPYCEMTASIMRKFHADVHVKEKSIVVLPKRYKPAAYDVETDWSSASYWFECLALRKGKLLLPGLKPNSFQGDAVLVDVYKQLGVQSSFEDDGLLIWSVLPETSELNLMCSDFPDLAQTLAVTCAGMGIGCDLLGLKTLKYKETDRIDALHIELNKFGIELITGPDFISFEACTLHWNEEVLETYQDHRMAMAFAPLCLKVDTLTIANPEVVGKSYPQFWKHLERMGFELIYPTKNKKESKI